MKKELTSNQIKAQKTVTKVMGDITRATTKVLMDYVTNLYLNSFGKVIAYLGPDSEEAKDLLNSMDESSQNQVLSTAHDFQKTDSQVISEVEHILVSCGMNLNDDYKIIKNNILNTGKEFAEKSLKDFRTQSPILQNRLNGSAQFQPPMLKKPVQKS